MTSPRPPIDPHYFASQSVGMLAAARSTNGAMNVALRDTPNNVLYLGQVNATAAKKLQLSYLKALPIASNPISAGKVAWFGDDLVMVGPTTNDTGHSIDQG